MHEHESLAAEFESQRHRLQEVAFRMLGSRPDADDAVQEAWLRLQRSDASHIGNLAGWLTTVTSRVCLDKLRSRRARPESTAADSLGDPFDFTTAPDDPAHEAVIADSVGRALAVVLDTLTPAERVALVLHDVFAVPFEEIATVLDRSTEATKKLAGRARRKAHVGDSQAPVRVDGHRQAIRAFLQAVRTGDMDLLLEVLAPDAVRHVDPVLLAPGSRTQVRGAHAIVREARTLSAPARSAELVLVDGVPGAAVVRGEKPTLVLTFDVVDGLITRFDVIAEPSRLSQLAITRYA
jgi:RNA polymerase sigma factor (sigma-70 family)